MLQTDLFQAGSTRGAAHDADSRTPHSPHTLRARTGTARRPPLSDNDPRAVCAGAVAGAGGAPLNGSGFRSSPTIGGRGGCCLVVFMGNASLASGEPEGGRTSGLPAGRCASRRLQAAYLSAAETFSPSGYERQPCRTNALGHRASAKRSYSRLTKSGPSRFGAVRMTVHDYPAMGRVCQVSVQSRLLRMEVLEDRKEACA